MLKKTISNHSKMHSCRKKKNYNEIKMKHISPETKIKSIEQEKTNKKEEINLEDIITNINSKNYLNILERIKKYLINEYSNISNKNITITFILDIISGIVNIKYSKLNQFTFILNKITLLQKTEISLIYINYSLSNCFFYLINKLLKNVSLPNNIQNILKINKVEYIVKTKSCDKFYNNVYKLNYHMISMIYYRIGYFFVNKAISDYNMQNKVNNVHSTISVNISTFNIKYNNILKKLKTLISKSKCNCCYICNNINIHDNKVNTNINNDKYKTNNKSLSVNNIKVIAKQNIINTNNKYIGEKKIKTTLFKNHSNNINLSKKKKNEFICPYQRYLLNTLSNSNLLSNKKNTNKKSHYLSNNNTNNTNNNTGTYTEFKTSSNTTSNTNFTTSTSNLYNHVILPKPSKLNNKKLIKNSIKKESSVIKSNHDYNHITKNKINNLEMSLSLIGQNIDFIENEFNQFKDFNVKIKNQIKCLGIY